MATVVKGIKVTIPAHQEKVETIISVPEGKTYTIRAVGKYTSSNYYFILEVDGDRLIEMPAELSMGYGDFIPFNLKVEGPADIKVGGKNRVSTTQAPVMAIVYED